MIKKYQNRITRDFICIGVSFAFLSFLGCSGGGGGGDSSAPSSTPPPSASCPSSNGSSSEERVTIAPDNPLIRYNGRVALSSSAALYDWANTQIEFRVNASQIELLLEDGKNDYNLFVNDVLQNVIETTADESTYPVDLGPGEHHIRLSKRTGPNYGSGQFLGVDLPLGGQLLALPEAPSRKIEFIGDSYTNGYGNEGPGLDCGEELRSYENSYLSFAPITARALEAQSHSIAISGFGAVRNYNDSNTTSDTPMPLFYNRTLQERSDLPWDFSSWIPDAVVIKLGTNDHSTQPRPPEDVFIQGIHGLIDQVNAAYGQLPIFLVADSSLSLVISRMQTATQEQHGLGNDQVHFVQVTHPPQNQLGCNWHPMIVGHESMATELAQAMRSELGW